MGRGGHLTGRIGPRLVEEARLPGKDSPRGEPLVLPLAGRAREQPGPGWEHIVGEALSAFVDDHGEEPHGWAQLQRFIEWYLKPSYVGHCAGSQELGRAAPASTTRRSRGPEIADGKTVRPTSCASTSASPKPGARRAPPTSPTRPRPSRHPD